MTNILPEWTEPLVDLQFDAFIWRWWEVGPALWK